MALSVGLLSHVFFHADGAFIFGRPLRGWRARTILRYGGRAYDNEERQHECADEPLQTRWRREIEVHPKLRDSIHLIIWLIVRKSEKGQRLL
jgi:hypothetical protein